MRLSRASLKHHLEHNTVHDIVICGAQLIRGIPGRSMLAS